MTDEHNAKKILIVEDDPYMITNLVELLGFEGFEVKGLSDGLQAPGQVRSYMPDLVLSDIGIPGLDGLTLLEMVRSDPQTAAIPFVILSGRADSEQRQVAQDKGANGYLVKPFEIDDLLKVVYQLLG